MRSASSGLRSSAGNGPRTPPRGPLAIACATRFCSAVIASGDKGRNRGAFMIALPIAVYEVLSDAKTHSRQLICVESGAARLGMGGAQRFASTMSRQYRRHALFHVISARDSEEYVPGSTGEDGYRRGPPIPRGLPGCFARASPHFQLRPY